MYPELNILFNVRFQIYYIYFITIKYTTNLYNVQNLGSNYVHNILQAVTFLYISLESIWR